MHDGLWQMPEHKATGHPSPLSDHNSEKFTDRQQMIRKAYLGDLKSSI